MLLDSCSVHARKVAFQQAAEAGYEQLTYGELGEMTRRFAGALVGAGFQPGDRLAIVAENRLEWVVAFFGQTLAGGAAVPIYPELPVGDIGRIIARAGARFLVTTEALSRPLDHGFAKVFLLPSRYGAAPSHAFSEALSAEPLSADRMQALANPRALVAIMFTSGTTGDPKGVMLTQGNFMADVNALSSALSVGRNDRLLLALPLHHAFPLTVGILAPVALGGEVTLENYLPHLARRFVETRPTVFMAVPALLEIMERNIRHRIERAGREKGFNRALRLSRGVKALTGVNMGHLLFRQVHAQLGGKLRFIISGGSALSPLLTRRFLELGIPLLQGWGLTEAAPVVTTQRWWPRRFYFSRYYERQAGSVGQPLPGMDVALIDRRDERLPIGATAEGELVVRGPNVTQGYWEDVNATRQVMLGNWLRTGDIGRIDSDSTVWITGRSKYVIVLDSGEKVHPEEVEEVLSQSPLFADVCVVPRTIRGKTQAWAIIYPDVRATQDHLARRKLSLTEAEVRDVVASEVSQLRSGLASYKWPAGVILTDRPLPKSVIGKVARERLEEAYEFQLDVWSAGPPEGPGDGDATA
jgi:long-chain acyl-CoA synthetase